MKNAGDCSDTDDDDDQPSHVDELLKDPMALIDFMDKNKARLFKTASANIKKAQKKQAASYNKRHTIRDFKAGEKVLKRNMKDACRKEKFKKKFLGPYEVIERKDNGTYLLKDKYSHLLRRAVPGSQLVPFYARDSFASAEEPSNKNENNYHTDEQMDISFNGIKHSTPVQSDVDENVNVESSNSSESEDPSDMDFTNLSSCQRTSEYINNESKSKKKGHKEDVIQSQITIIPSNDNPMSSDESVVIDVGNVSFLDAAMNKSANEMHSPLEFVDNLFDSPVKVTKETPPTPVYFSPLSDDERAAVAKRLNISVNPKKKTYIVSGHGKLLEPGKKPEIYVSASQNGACLYNSYSWLLGHSEHLNFILRHAICNFIEDAKNYDIVKRFIPEKYKNGKSYIKAEGHRNTRCWATEVQIFIFSIMSQHDTYIYTQQGTWVRYPHNVNEKIRSKTAWFIDNSSAVHFDPFTRC